MFAGNELKIVVALCLKLVGAKLQRTLKVLLERKVLAGTYCSSFNCVGQWELWVVLCASFNKLNWRRSWMSSQPNFRTSFVLANLLSTKPAAADRTF